MFTPSPDPVPPPIEALNYRPADDSENDISAMTEISLSTFYLNNDPWTLIYGPVGEQRISTQSLRETLRADAGRCFKELLAMRASHGVCINVFELPDDGTIVGYSVWRPGDSDTAEPDYERRTSCVLGVLATLASCFADVCIAELTRNLYLMPYGPLTTRMVAFIEGIRFLRRDLLDEELGSFQVRVFYLAVHDGFRNRGVEENMMMMPAQMASDLGKPWTITLCVTALDRQRYNDAAEFRKHAIRYRAREDAKKEVIRLYGMAWEA